MKKLGCPMVILGLLLSVASFLLFGRAITRAVSARLVKTVPIEVGEKTTTDVITVDTDKFCQIAIKMRIRTESVQEKEEFGDVEYEGRYKFPVAYRVSDAQGSMVLSENVNAQWNEGSRSFSVMNMRETGGTLTAQQSFAKFRVPPPGDIRVEVKVEPDTRYGAEASDVALKVYDNVSKHAASVASGIAMLLLGPVLVLVGFILFTVGLLTRKKRM